jgi:hypothetical protein
MTELYDWRRELDRHEICAATDTGHLCELALGHDEAHRCVCGYKWRRLPHPSTRRP